MVADDAFFLCDDDEGSGGGCSGCGRCDFRSGILSLPDSTLLSVSEALPSAARSRAAGLASSRDLLLHGENMRWNLEEMDLFPCTSGAGAAMATAGAESEGSEASRETGWPVRGFKTGDPASEGAVDDTLGVSRDGDLPLSRFGGAFVVVGPLEEEEAPLADRGGSIIVIGVKEV